MASVRTWTQAEDAACRERTATLVWRCSVIVAVVCSTLAAEGSRQPALDFAAAPVAVRPANLSAAPVFQPVLERMWRSSPTFNQQCRRLVAAPQLKVVLRLEDVQRRPSFCARAILGRRSGILVSAEVFLTLNPDSAELIAHELEHILEQLDGVDLEAHLGSGLVWRREDGAFETRRATDVGRRVAREVERHTSHAERER